MQIVHKIGLRILDPSAIRSSLLLLLWPRYPVNHSLVLDASSTILTSAPRHRRLGPKELRVRAHHKQGTLQLGGGQRGRQRSRLLYFVATRRIFFRPSRVWQSDSPRRSFFPLSLLLTLPCSRHSLAQLGQPTPHCSRRSARSLFPFFADARLGNEERRFERVWSQQGALHETFPSRPRRTGILSPDCIGTGRVVKRRRKRRLRVQRRREGHDFRKGQQLPLPIYVPRLVWIEQRSSSATSLPFPPATAYTWFLASFFKTGIPTARRQRSQSGSAGDVRAQPRTIRGILHDIDPNHASAITGHSPPKMEDSRLCHPLWDTGRLRPLRSDVDRMERDDLL